MIPMKEKSKRKNDDPSRKYRLAAKIIVAIIIGVVGVATIYVRLMINIDPPAPQGVPVTGTLYSIMHGRFYGLNLETRDNVAVSALPPLEGQTSDALSHDGRWNAKWSLNEDGQRYNLTIEDMQTHHERLLEMPFLADTRVSWSADDEWLAITAYGGLKADGTYDRSRGWIIARETGIIHPVITDISVQRATFAPKGDHLAYIGEGILWVLDTSTGVKTRVALLNVMDETIVWSPDGEWLAYRMSPPEMQQQGPTADDSPVNIWAVRADGADAQMLFSGKAIQLLGWTP